MARDFSAEELYSTKTYNIGEDVVIVEQEAIYVGASAYDDMDWLNIARVIVNGNVIFDYKEFHYGPQKISDELVISKALAYPEDIQARYAFEQYEEYEKQISSMSILERVFNKKTYNKLVSNMKRVEKEYLYVKGIMDSSLILRKTSMIVDKSPSDSKNTVEQPGSY